MAAYYCIRRLSPYQGMLQVVEVDNASAFSTDGRHWQVRVVTQSGRQRWLGAGASHGLIDEPEGQFQDLQIALQQRPEIPFPPGDHFELWLLDTRNLLPLVLLKTRSRRSEMDKVDDPSWRPFFLQDSGFHSPTLQAHEKPRDPRVWKVRHQDVLERLVNYAARPFPAAQWFARKPDGSGEGGKGLRLPEDFIGRTLKCADFPELLVSEQWEAPQDAGLVRDYHDWMAPMLLAHANISHATRQRLEQAACKQPERLSEHYRQAPEIIDREAIDVALVTARIMQSS